MTLLEITRKAYYKYATKNRPSREMTRALGYLLAGQIEESDELLLKSLAITDPFRHARYSPSKRPRNTPGIPSEYPRHTLGTPLEYPRRPGISPAVRELPRGELIKYRRHER